MVFNVQTATSFTEEVAVASATNVATITIDHAIISPSVSDSRFEFTQWRASGQSRISFDYEADGSPFNLVITASATGRTDVTYNLPSHYQYQ